MKMPKIDKTSGAMLIFVGAFLGIVLFKFYEFSQRKAMRRRG
jgi:hypothetical protein